MFENRKKRENMKIKIVHKSLSKRSSIHRIRSLQRRADAWCQRKRWHHLPYL